MKNKQVELPDIPNKRYFSIGETSKLCLVKPHVLRYWEQEFPQLRPSTRTGGRRYYQEKDILLVRKIRELLYHEGFTIAGAKQQIQSFKPDQSVATIASASDDVSTPTNPFEQLIEELETLLENLR